MSESFKVRSNEHGIVRLFAVDSDSEPPLMSLEPDYEADQDDPPWPLKDALGVTYLDPDFLELFDVDDVNEIGLSGYLTMGLGIAEADIEPDRPRLDGLKGRVLVVVSSALGGFEATIKPKSPLRWIGTYVEESVPVKFEPLPNEGAKGAPLAPEVKPQDMQKSGRWVLLTIFALVILVFAIWGLV